MHRMSKVFQARHPSLELVFELTSSDTAQLKIGVLCSLLNVSNSCMTSDVNFLVVSQLRYL